MSVQNAVKVVLAGDVTVVTATIPNADFMSSAVNLGGGARQLTGVIMPAAWTASNLSFAVSGDGVAYSPLYWNGAEYTIAAAGGAAAGSAISLNPDVFAGWPYVMLRSGVVGAPVNQLAERVFSVVTRTT